MPPPGAGIHYREYRRPGGYVIPGVIVRGLCEALSAGLAAVGDPGLLSEGHLPPLTNLDPPTTACHQNGSSSDAGRVSASSLLPVAARLRPGGS